MQSKIQTSDKDTRLGFKARIADKIAQSLVPPTVPDVVEPVQVTVPVNFHTMSKYHLFGYLTHEAGLTLEQANDVIELLLDNKTATAYTQYNITLQGVHSLKELEAECILPEPPKSVKIMLPYNFNNLRVQDRFLWLMKESHLGLSQTEVNDVIDIAQGKTQVTDTQFTLTYAEAPILEPTQTQTVSHSVIDEIPQLTHFDIPEFPEGFELKTRVEQYRVLTDQVKLTPEHARFVLDTMKPVKEQADPLPEPEPNIVYVSLPYAFKGWVHKDQFAFLTKIKHLSTSDAEDVLGHYDGRQTLSIVSIDWEDVADPEGRTKFKSQLTSRIDQAKVKEPAPIQSYEIPELPEGFQELTGNEQLRALLDLQLTPEHAHFVLDSITPKVEPEATPRPVVKRQEIISVSLPHAFKEWNASDRFAFLTKNKHLSTSKAEDVLAHYDGQQQLSTVFIDWEDVVDPEGRLSLKQRLLDRIQNAKFKELPPVQVFDIPDLPEGFSLLTGNEQLRALLDIQLTPEHAYFVMASLEQPTPEPEPEKQELPQVISVSVPNAFKGWNLGDKFAFLTKNKHLSTFEANDVLAYYDGKQTNSTIELSWEDVVDPEGRLSLKQRLAERIENANAKAKESFATATYRFDMPELPEGFNLLSGMDQYRVLTVDMKLVPEHAYLVLRSLVQPVPAVESVAIREEVLSVSIPHAFKGWGARDRFAFLTKTKHLSSFDANDVLAFCDGKQTKATIELTWEDIVDPEGRSSFKSSLANKLEQTKTPIPAEVFVSEPVAERFEVITLPETFSSFSELDKYVYLTRNKEISHDTALEILDGSPQFKIEFASPSSRKDEISSLKPTIVVKPTPNIKKTINSKAKSKIYVGLPPAFNSLNAGEQYWYLVKTKELSYAEANDLLALLSNKPQTGNTEFVIDWEE